MIRDGSTMSALMAQKSEEHQHVMCLAELVILQALEHKWWSWGISICLFLLLLLQQVIKPFVENESLDETGSSTTWIDVCSWILCFSPTNSRSDEIFLGLTITIFIVLLISIFLMALTVLTTVQSVTVSGVFAALWFYVWPICSVTIANAFQRSYVVGTDDFTGFVYLGFFVHFLFLAWQVVAACFNSASALLVNHIFIARTPLRGLIVVSYFVSIGSLKNIYFGESGVLLWICLIMSVIVAIWGLCDPFYYHRLLNVGITCSALYYAITDIVWLAKGFDRDLTLYMLIPSCLVPVFVYYVVYPRIAKNMGYRRLLFEYMCGHRKEAEAILSDFKAHDVYQDLHTYMVLGMDLDAPTSMAILLQYTREAKTSLDEVFFLWTASNKQREKAGVLEVTWQNILQEHQVFLENVEREFWYRAWLCDLSWLPKLAGMIGRSVVECVNILVMMDDMHVPNAIGFINEVYRKKDEVQTATPSQKIKHRIGKLTVATLVHVIVFLVISILSWVVLRTPALYINDTERLRGVTNTLLNTILSYSGGDNTEVMKTGVMTTIAAINEFTSYNEKLSTDVFSVKVGKDGTCVMDALTTFLKDLDTGFTMDKLQPVVDSYTGAVTQLSEVLDKDLTFHTYKKIGKIVVIAMGVVSLLFAVISAELEWRKQKNLAEKFRFVDVKTLENMVDGLETEVDLMNSFSVDRNIGFIRSYPTTALYYLLFLVVNAFVLGMGFWVLEMATKECDQILLYVDDIAEVHSLAMLISNGVASYYYNGLTVVAKDWEVIDNRMDDCMRNRPDVGKYILMEKGLPSVISNTLLSGLLPISTTEVAKLTYQFAQRVNDGLDQARQINSYIFRRMLIQNVIAIMGVVLIMIAKGIVRRMSTAELDQLQRMYRIVGNAGKSVDDFELADTDDDKSESDFTISGEALGIEDMPITMMCFDKDLVVTMVTTGCKERFNMKIGKKLKESTLNRAILFEIEKRVAELRESLSEDDVSIDMNDGNYFTMKAFYVYDEDHLDIDYIVGTVVEHSTGQLVRKNREFESFFQHMYPSFISQDQELPVNIDGNGNKSIMVITKLTGFHAWATRGDPEVVQRYRREVSEIFDRIVQEQTTICRLRESSDTLIAVLHRDVMKESGYMWKLGEISITFSKQIFKQMKQCSQKYGISDVVFPTVLIIKFKDAGFFLSEENLALVDIKADYLFTGEDLINKCRSDNISYIALFKEQKVSNSTFLKTCYTSNSDKYDILVIV